MKDVFRHVRMGKAANFWPSVAHLPLSLAVTFQVLGSEFIAQLKIVMIEIDNFHGGVLGVFHY